ncbi:hypothetical protein ABT213_30785 [Streptomyces sp. NPDC001674]
MSQGGAAVAYPNRAAVVLVAVTSTRPAPPAKFPGDLIDVEFKKLG